MTTALPTNISFGKVRGRFGSPILSAGDADGLPDFLPLSGLEVTFTPKPDVILNLGATPVPVTFLTEKITCTLDADGYLVGPDGREGINLIATDDEDLAPHGWTYAVSFGGSQATYKRLAGFDISVPAGSTRWLTAIAPLPSASGTSTLDEVQAAVLQMGVAVGQAQSSASAAAVSAQQAAASAQAAANSVASTSHNVDNLQQATTLGKALMKATDATAAQTTIGATTVGKAVLTAASAAAARTVIGATTVGQDLITAASTSAAQTAIGASTVGKSLFGATDAAAGRAAISAVGLGDLGGTRVKDHGAVGDWNGTTGTDDTAAINAAIAAAAGGPVVFEAKRYRVVGGLTGGTNGTRLVGQGRRATELHNDGTAGVALITTPSGSRGYGIEHMFLSSKSGSNQGACIKIGVNFGEISIVDVEINAYGSAAGVQQIAGNGIHLYMEQVRVNGGTKAFDFFNVGTIPINTIDAVACYANDAEQYGWDIANVTQFNPYGCSGDNCGIRTTPGYGWRLAGSHTTLTGCTAENNGTGGLGGGFYLPGGNTAVFINCSTFNQGQPFQFNGASLNAVLMHCHTSGTIPFGSAMALSSYQSLMLLGGNLIVGAVANSAFGTRVGPILVAGSMIVDNATSGFITRSADGTYWRQTTANATGALTATSLGTSRPAS